MPKEPVYFDIPVPEDPETIVSVHDGNRWIQGIIPGTVRVNGGLITFVVNWNHGHERRRFTLAADLIAGYMTNDG